MVLYSLDGGDILLHYCKMLRLLDNIYFLPNLFKVVMFVPLPVSWFYFRICLYFVKVLINSMYTGVLYAGWQNSHYYFYFNFLLICIWLLQVRKIFIFINLPPQDFSTVCSIINSIVLFWK